MKLKKILQNAIICSAITAAATVFGYSNALAEKPTQNKIESVYVEGTIVDKKDSTFYDSFIRFGDTKGNQFLVEQLHSRDNNGTEDTMLGGARFNLSSERLNGKLDLFGLRSTSGTRGTGINFNAMIDNKVFVGGNAETLEQNDARTDLLFGYTGMKFGDNILQYGFGQRIEPENTVDLQTLVFGRDITKNLYGGAGIGFEDNETNATFVLGRHVDEKWKEPGFRIFGKTNLKGNYFVDGIFTLDSTFPRGAQTAITNMYDAGLQDRSIVRDALDSRLPALHQRGRLALELTSIGKDDNYAHTVGLAYNLPKFHNVQPYMEAFCTKAKTGDEHHNIYKGTLGANWKGLDLSVGYTKPEGSNPHNTFFVGKSFSF